MSYYIGKCGKCDQAVDENTGICCQCGWSFDQDMKDNPQNYFRTHHDCPLILPINAAALLK